MTVVVPFLSVVVPAHRSEDFIAANVRTILEALDALGEPVEVIVVVDGRTDRSADRARGLGDARVRVFEYEDNQGKGFALCVGVAHARGRLIGWLDADLDIGPEVMVRAAQRLVAGDVDAVLGSKRHPDSVVDYPASRRVLSWGFQRLVRVALRVNVSDTQTGAKVFRREVLETVMPLLLIKRYAFDLEVLAVSALFGFDRFTEVPIKLEYQFLGSGINSRAVQNMFVDTMAIAFRVRLRHWYVRQYAALHRRRLEAVPGSPAKLPTVPASNLAAFQKLLPDDPALEVEVR